MPRKLGPNLTKSAAGDSAPTGNGVHRVTGDRDIDSTLDEFIESYEAALADEDWANAEWAQQDWGRVRDYFPPHRHPEYSNVALELLRVDLEARWRLTGLPRLERYLQEFADCLSTPAAQAALAFEEYRLRRGQGEEVTVEEYQLRHAIATDLWPPSALTDSSRNSTWDSPNSASQELAPATLPSQNDTAVPTQSPTVKVPEHDARSPSGKGPLAAPQVGDRVLDFELLEVLGQGRFGKVFRARQASLANREVAVKFSRELWYESDLLAQLQHPGIVPVYSVHQIGVYQLICMPYVGRKTLADVMRRLSGSLAVAGGTELVEALEPSAEPAANSAHLRYLRQLDHESLMLDLVRRLAEALVHAHQRQIIHRDLKPANILFNAQGEPLLLDFNLSAQLVVEHTGDLLIGGTLPYLAPEHLQAILQGGQVTCAADIYSLGVILYELLIGRLPFPHRTGRHLAQVLLPMIEDRRGLDVALNPIRRRISPGTLAILRKCLDSQLSQRYSDATQLVTDLQLQLARRPLQFAPNTCPFELTRKWAQRHRRRIVAASVVGLSLAGMSVAWGVAARQNHAHSVAQAQTFHQALQRDLQAAQIPLTVPTTDDLAIHAAIRDAEQVIQRWDTAPQLGWEARPMASWWQADQVTAIELELREVAYLLGQAHRKLAARRTGAAAGEELRVAQIWEQRAGVNVASTEGSGVDKRAAEPSRATTLSPALLAYASADYTTAKKMLEPRTDESPQDFATWFLLGHCHYLLDEHAMAQQAYSACAVLDPSSHLAFFHRGLSRMEGGEFATAEVDFTRVLQKKPDMTSALMNRGLCRKAQGELHAAMQDLTRAIELGRQDAQVYLVRSRIYAELGQPQEAARDREAGLAATPVDEQGWIARGLARLEQDPQRASDDFATALRWNPRSRNAQLQLVRVWGDRLGQPDKAMEQLNQMLAQRPADAEALMGRAVLQARQGSVDAARQDCEQALNIDDRPLMRYQAACVWSLTARPDTEDTLVALRHLMPAVQQEDRWRRLAEQDPDLQQLRSTPAFQQALTLTP